MRKFISLLLVLMLALGLAACGSESEEPSEASEAPSGAEGDTPSVAIRLRIVCPTRLPWRRASLRKMASM